MIDHLEELWGDRWWLPGGFVVAYWAVLLGLGGLRLEHLAFGAATVAAAYIGPRSKQFLVVMLPYIAVGIGYDSLRYARGLTLDADRVLTCSLREIDALFFPGPGGSSLQEWLVRQSAPSWDIVAAAPYAVFAYAAFVYAVYLYFVDRPRARVYLWSFAVANFLAFAMWLLVPAAAPWYVRDYGCAVDLAQEPSAAGLLRVDQQLGVAYFERFYSRTTSVFGALPSMHNAYPLLGLLTAWPSIGWRTKPFHVLYLVWMLLSSMYLDHHWLIDAVAGWVVAWVGVVAARRIVCGVG